MNEFARYKAHLQGLSQEQLEAEHRSQLSLENLYASSAAARYHAMWYGASQVSEDAWKIRFLDGELEARQSQEYHIHVYGEDREIVCFYFLDSFPELEREEGPVGPHPEGQIGLIAKVNQLSPRHLQAIADRKKVSILVHPVMEDEISAHTTHAQWYGEKIELNLDFFRTLE